MKKILCSNCYQQKIVDKDNEIERVKFLKEHKTRIGNSYCKIGHIGKSPYK